MTTCRTCSRSWSSLVECHCSVCHEHFSTVTGFDLHKPNAEEGCLNPATIENKNGIKLLKLVQRAEGKTWVGVVTSGSLADRARETSAQPSEGHSEQARHRGTRASGS